VLCVCGNRELAALPWPALAHCVYHAYGSMANDDGMSCAACKPPAQLTLWHALVTEEVRLGVASTRGGARCDGGSSRAAPVGGAGA